MSSSGGGWNLPGNRKIPDRRLSSTGQVSGSPIDGAARSDQKRPLTAVLSEDASSKQHSSSQLDAQQTNPGRQSFLSKLTTRSDSRGSTTITASEKNLSGGHNQRRPTQDETGNTGRVLSSRSLVYGTECDKSVSHKQNTNDLENKTTSKLRQASGVDADKGIDSKENSHDGGANQEEDEDNQVIPSWPSKSEASRTKTTEFIQHKVYSLKDYSQVASPTAAPPTNQAKASQQQPVSSSGNKLLKSMSQDRKVKPNTKRLSECLYLSTASPLVIGSILSSADQQQQQQQHHQQLKASTSVNKQHPSQATGGSYGLLPPETGSHSSVLLGESRIDRMRKLFVSPLSLKSYGGSGGVGGGHGGSKGAMRGPSHQQRLSFQSGASSMLNKPQHLMYAMYRNGGHHGGGATRRSPGRQKQAKSFRVYGCPLQMANNIYPITCFGRADIYKQQSVPYVLARLCNYIEENSSHLTHEGIFRVSGNARLMEKLRTLFDHLGDAPLESESVDVATSASMLKMYLRELPEPLIPTRMNYYFTTLAKKYSPFLAKDNASNSSFLSAPSYRQSGHATSTSVTPTTTNTATTTDTNSSDNVTSQQLAVEERQRLAFSRDLTKLVRKLPTENYNLLKYLACFLYRITLKQEYNKMCAEALGIVFGPNVFRIRNESYKGLREQELSNQIMASIISNYRSIFDSEITDPLGNLIEMNEELTDDERLLMKVVSGHHTPTTASVSESSTTNSMPTADTTIHYPAEAASLRQGPQAQVTADMLTNPAPMPSTSRIAACCPAHCQAHNEPVLRDLVGDDEEDDHDDDDDVSDEGESYTPSTNSDSYCSSIASETIETSSCDGAPHNAHDGAAGYDEYAARGMRYSKRRVGDNPDVVSAQSSSECSDTSYTPTSSHSDSDAMPDDEADEADESLDDSSSFDSSLSMEAGERKDQNQRDQPVCRVCERRQSAHLDRMANGDIVTKACDTTLPRRANGLEQHPYESQRRKRAEKKPPDLSANIVEEAPEEENEPVPVDNNTLSAEKSQTIGADAATTAGTPVTTSSSNVPPQARPTTKNLGGLKSSTLRRRSSSASSLSRVKQRRDQMMANAAKSRHQQPLRSHRMTSERASRSRHNSSRRPRGKGHSVKRSHNVPADGATKTSGSTGLREPPSRPGEVSSKSLRRHRASRRHQHRSLPPRHGSSFEVGWSNRHRWLAEAPGFESYFLLRSFNSDETLLKSFNCGSLRHEVSRVKTRRRFSGNDAQASMVSYGPAVRPCARIFEEELGTSRRPADTCQAPGSTIHQASYGKAEPSGFDASFVSLLDNKLMSFRKSDVSIDRASSHGRDDDCVWVQMRATKELMRAIRRLQRQGSTLGYTVEMEQLVVKLSTEELNGYGDDSSACDVDFLSALSLIEQIESNLGAANVDSRLVTDIEHLNAILNAKLSLLKQRHADLKAIRDHYLRSHAERRREKTHQPHNSPLGANRSKSESRIHTTLSAIVRKDEANSAATASDTASPRKLSAPGKEIQASCSSSTSSLADPKRAYCWPTASSNRASKSDCKFGSLCPIEFVFNIEKQLASKRIQGARVVKLNEMTMDQLISEKLELQKNLLRYEHWFGRPTSRLEFSLVGHIYERYRAVKMIKSSRDQLACEK